MILEVGAYRRSCIECIYKGVTMVLEVGAYRQSCIECI